MIYFVFADKAHKVLERILTGDNAYEDCSEIMHLVETSNEFKHTWERVQELAHMATQMSDETFLPADRGESTSPRYTVVIAPKIGDKVSYAFNGDYYPCGEITKMSKSFRRIETSTGRVFYRRRESDVWKNGKTWSMVHGHISRLNPEF